MPPRREGPNPIDAAQLATLIAQQMAAVLPGIVNQINQVNNANAGQNLNPNANNQPQCTFKHFQACNPTKFEGTEGGTGLYQWLESMENTFINSDCPENLKVRRATSVFQKRALTWWNAEKRNRGTEVALALPWEEVKEMMRREFCSPSERRKLELEFWDLKQESGENVAYNTRFHELSYLIPHLVTPVSRAVEKYIYGLPKEIRDSVFSRNPATVEEAIILAGTLTDSHVRDGTLTRKGEKASVKPTTTEPSSEEKPETTIKEPDANGRKRKATSLAVVTHTPTSTQTSVAPNPVNPNRKPYNAFPKSCCCFKLSPPPHCAYFN